MFADNPSRMNVLQIIYSCVGNRPGELYYQMGVVVEQFKAQDGVHAPETLQSKQSWTQRALHTNPSCTHYWVTLQQFHHL